MNRTLVTATAIAIMVSTASAADFGMMQQASPAVYDTARDWTGFYAGVFGGISAGDVDFNAPGPGGGVPGFSVATNAAGGVLGFQLGADYQVQQFLVGAVADIAWSGLNAESSFVVPGLGGLSYNSKINYIGTVRARVGFLPTDDLLIYAHGGYAYSRSEPSLSLGGVGAAGIVAANRSGWTAGAGVEYAIMENVSLVTEYSYTDLGSVSVSDGSIPGGATEDLRFHTVKAGFNWRF